MMTPSGLMGSFWDPLDGLMSAYTAQGKQPVVMSPLEMELRRRMSANGVQGLLNPLLFPAIQGGLLGSLQDQSGLMAGAPIAAQPPRPDSRQIVRAPNRTHVGQSWDS